MSHRNRPSQPVIPAKARIQYDVRTVDPGVRRDDGSIEGDAT